MPFEQVYGHVLKPVANFGAGIVEKYAGAHTNLINGVGKIGEGLGSGISNLGQGAGSFLSGMGQIGQFIPLIMIGAVILIVLKK